MVVSCRGGQGEGRGEGAANVCGAKVYTTAGVCAQDARSPAGA
jgi:hypothetical protein